MQRQGPLTGCSGSLYRPHDWGGQGVVVFDTPERAPAAGQTAAFYDGDVVLGGGFID